LFVLYINDLPKHFQYSDANSGILLYADDTKLFSDDSILLQENLNLKSFN